MLGVDLSSCMFSLSSIFIVFSQRDCGVKTCFYELRTVKGKLCMTCMNVLDGHVDCGYLDL